MKAVVVALLPKDWCLCRAIAEFEVPCLARKRQQVLRNCLILCCAGFVLAFFGFLGGYSGGAILKALPWTVWKLPDNKVAYGGVRWACNGTIANTAFQLTRGVHAVSFADPVNCTKWSDMDCSHIRNSASCELCKNTAKVTAVPVAISVVTYLLFANHARARYVGKDSAQHKIMACFSAFVGGFNFLGTMITYWESCVKTAASAPGVDASFGSGLLCMLIGATGLKVLVALLQLGIPVEEPDSDEDDDSTEEYEAMREKEESGDSTE
mmetsp:Transcript_85452/g.250122  ORF Transcript_85452/g.250122 Transcript_85452/m.250122 type:complete len:267 (+) Transcript_85452:71-871(+)